MRRRAGRNPKSAEWHNWLGVFRQQKNQSSMQFRNSEGGSGEPDFSGVEQSGLRRCAAGDWWSCNRISESGCLDGADPQLRMNLGIALRGKGDADGAALEEFRTVVKRPPDHAEAHQQLALTMKQQGNLEGAIQEFEAVLGLDSEHARPTTISGRRCASRRGGRRGGPGSRPADRR